MASGANGAAVLEQWQETRGREIAPARARARRDRGSGPRPGPQDAWVSQWTFCHSPGLRLTTDAPQPGPRHEEGRGIE